MLESTQSAARRSWKSTVRKHVHHESAPGSENFWEPGLECASRDDLRALQDEKFISLVRYLNSESPYFRERFRRCGYDVDGAKGVADLRRLPVLSRQDLAEDQELSPPWGLAAPVPSEAWSTDGWLFFSTSGTTGSPLAFRATRHDRTLLTWLYARSLYAGGVRPGTVAFNCFSYGPFSAFWGMHLALNLMGCPVIPGGGMDTRRRAALIARYRPDILIGTPSYLLYLADTMNEMGWSPSELGIRFLLTAGEPGPCIPATKIRIVRAWGGATIVDNYGTTEVAPAPLAYTCKVQASRTDAPISLHISEDAYLVEVLDPDTHEPVPPGDQGILVATNLWSEGQSFLRYRIGDYLRISTDPCDCGRSHALVEGGFEGRPDDMIKLRGVTLFPSSVEGIVRDVPGLSVEFQLVRWCRADGMEEVTVRLEPLKDVGEADWMGLKKEAARRLYESLGVRLEVEMVPPGSLPRTEFKAKRIVDERAG